MLASVFYQLGINNKKIDSYRSIVVLVMEAGHKFSHEAPVGWLSIRYLSTNDCESGQSRGALRPLRRSTRTDVRCWLDEKGSGAAPLSASFINLVQMGRAEVAPVSTILELELELEFEDNAAN